jgi:tetraacyldisaccharide 4'-kinase
LTFIKNPLSLAYYAGLSLDRAVKKLRVQTLPRPVISIGNLSVGGTGKTPLVIKILADLKSFGIRPAVLTRGYKSENGFSDEAALILQYHPDVPVGVGADRVQSASDILAKHNVDVFVLDDGFQHWRLLRALDVVCVDGTNPWAGGLLPLGRLREPKSALSRAGLVVVTRLELVSEKEKNQLWSELSEFVPNEKIIASRFQMALRDWKTGASFLMNEMQGKRAVVVTGVGRPESLEEALTRAGASVLPMRFRDHHYYTDNDLRNIEQLATREKALVVTTEKDLVKLERTKWGREKSLPFGLYVAVVQHGFSAEDESKWEAAIKRAALGK